MIEIPEIKMFRLKTLNSSTIPVRWVVIHYKEGESRMASFTRKGENFNVYHVETVEPLSLAHVATAARTAEVCWVVCEGMYDWLCSQGIYQQIIDGVVSLPLENSESECGHLKGRFATGDPTTIDVSVCNKRLLCLDFANLGIHEIKDADDGVEKLTDYLCMIEKLEMGSVKPTAAAQGNARYRTHDMDNHRIYCHQVPEVRKMERAAFYGGRAECLTLGKITSPCYHFDAVSMHPTIGLTEKFPTKLVDHGQGDNMQRILFHHHRGRHIIAKVDLEADSPDYPIRYQEPGDQKRWITIYPTGKFSTTLANPEFIHALKNDRIRKIVCWAAYECDAIFKENSEWYFEAKKKIEEIGLGHMKGSLKLCQNSLYGNLGRRGRKWIDTLKWHDADWGMWWGRHPIHGNVVNHRAIFGQHQYLDAGGEPETSCPAISATMFSYSRMALLKLIQTAEWPNVHLYDTDGLIVDQKGAVRLLELGPRLKLKESGSDVDIRGIKYYRFGKRWCHAGIPAWAERHEDGSASFEKHEPFNLGLWRKTPFAHKYQVAANDPYPKYRHGIVCPDGRTVPFHLPIEEKK